ncbi:MAG: dTMP kinase [Lentisphaerae bacterium]|nr:dTMP kinase [Lentisphaerota bacterium]
MRGKLITFEGVEGGGKSTQAKRLAERLRAEGIDVLTTREPGGTPTGEVIRDLLQHNLGGEPLCDAAEALLFCASRAQICRNVLGPALAAGTWVVLDRFTDSTLAYQGYGRGFDLATLRAMNDFATGDVKPALTVLIDIPVELGLSRVLARSNGTRDRIESAPLEFHKRLQAGYLEMAKREPERFIVIDGTAEHDAVLAKIWEAVETRLLRA